MKLIASIAGLLLSLALLPAAQPNIILVLLDDIGTGWVPPYAERLSPDDIEPEIFERYVRVHGHQGKVDLEKHIEAASNCMPTLSTLASQGAVFDRAYATTALCSPSRAALLTGSFQQSWGAYWNKDVDDFGIPLDRTLLAEPLAEAGYRTGVVGKWHVAPNDSGLIEQVWVEDLGESLPVHPHYKGKWPQILERLKTMGWRSSSEVGYHPLDRGFDYYFGYNSYDDYDYASSTLWEGRERVPTRPKDEFLTDLFNEKACAFVEDSLRAEEPFFLYYAPKTLHGPISPPPSRYTDAFNSGNEFTNQYAGHLLALDNGLSMLLDLLKEYDQERNTLIIFTSDNGCTLYNVPPYNAPHRGGKGTGWNGGMNVPFVVWQPGVVQPGVNGEITSLTDVMPTILDAAGVETPKGVTGQSLMPYLTGKTTAGPRDQLGAASIHSSRWSYSYETGGENHKQDATKAPLYAWIIDGNYQLMLVTTIRPGLYQALPEGYPEQTLLFNLEDDVQQRRNLADEQPDRVFHMTASLHQWLSEQKEPLTSQQNDYHALLRRSDPQEFQLAIE